MSGKENLTAYENHFPANTLSEITILHNGNERCAPGKKTGPCVLDHYLFNLVLSGKGTLTIGNRSYRLTAGHGFLIRPGQIYQCVADRSDPLHYTWIGFNGEGIRGILYNSKLMHIDPIYASDEWAELREYMDRSVDAVKKGEPGALVYCQGMLILILSHLLKHTYLFQEPKDLTKLTSEQEIYIQQAVGYIQANLSKTFTVSDIADALGLNRSYFSRLFTKLCGIPPVRFIDHYRLDNAWHLLRHTNISVAEIGSAVGYQDPAYFSKRFTERYGVSPSLLRSSGNSGK